LGAPGTRKACEVFSLVINIDGLGARLGLIAGKWVEEFLFGCCRIF